MSKFHTPNNIIMLGIKILCWNTVLKNGQVITSLHKASAEIRQCSLMYFPMIRRIVKYHDNEPNGANRSDPTGKSHPRKATGLTSIGTGRTRPICVSSLSVQEGIPANMRNCRKVRQANRAVCHFELPNRRKSGLQGRTSPMGGPPADRRLITATLPALAIPAAARTSLEHKSVDFRQCLWTSTQDCFAPTALVIEGQYAGTALIVPRVERGVKSTLPLKIVEPAPSRRRSSQMPIGFERKTGSLAR